MASVALTTVLYVAEPIFMAVAMIALLRSREQRRFPALLAYFALRLGSSVALQLMLNMRRVVPVDSATAYAWYFYTYWLSYVVGAILVFMVIQELFRCSMDPFPGLKWLGTISFRWVACISFVVASAALLTPGGNAHRLLLAVVVQAMRCESVFMLSLLLFLMMAAGKLGLSYRSRVFGISLGFGIMAASDLVVSAAFQHFEHTMMTSAVSVTTTSASLLTLFVWSAYFLQQEPARQITALESSSALARWNEIAMSIGQGSGRIPVTTPAGQNGGPVAVPANNFFLQDVETVVDRILIKNSLHKKKLHIAS